MGGICSKMATSKSTWFNTVPPDQHAGIPVPSWIYSWITIVLLLCPAPLHGHLATLNQNGLSERIWSSYDSYGWRGEVDIMHQARRQQCKRRGLQCFQTCCSESYANAAICETNMTTPTYPDTSACIAPSSLWGWYNVDWWWLVIIFVGGSVRDATPITRSSSTIHARLFVIFLRQTNQCAIRHRLSERVEAPTKGWSTWSQLQLQTMSVDGIKTNKHSSIDKNGLNSLVNHPCN